VVNSYPSSQVLSGPKFAKLLYLRHSLAHPRWLAAFLMDDGTPHFKKYRSSGERPMPLANVRAALARMVVTWEDMCWLRGIWKGSIAVTGVMMAEDDARRAVDEGAAAIVVSNRASLVEET
jgi:isopentenyl diphosphate isomerase/L-lactate dehydrogenase-like FMN-dependent dehydrogenase